MVELLTECYQKKYSILYSQEWSNILRCKEHHLEEHELFLQLSFFVESNNKFLKCHLYQCKLPSKCAVKLGFLLNTFLALNYLSNGQYRKAKTKQTNKRK